MVEGSRPAFLERFAAFYAILADRAESSRRDADGPQSHAAILARSLGIPMVGQVPDLVSRINPGRRLEVDGTAGLIRLDPPMRSEALPNPCAAPATVQPTAKPYALIDLPGVPRLEANINLLCEVDRAVAEGTEGVGLYRSEFLFLARRTLPTEEEQVGIYRKLLQRLGGRPATIRTYDFRPDKLAHYSHLSSSTSHPLDWRLVLDSLPLQKLFKDQVRAILRAAVRQSSVEWGVYAGFLSLTSSTFIGLKCAPCAGPVIYSGSREPMSMSRRDGRTGHA
jgi:phosphoenolpyruvate-protein kinase (PTS system EI component)